MNLTGDQKRKLHEILNDTKTQREMIHKHSGLTDEQKQEKLKNLRSWTRSKVNDLLTPEQRNRLTAKLKAVPAKAKFMHNTN